MGCAVASTELDVLGSHVEVQLDAALLDQLSPSLVKTASVDIKAVFDANALAIWGTSFFGNKLTAVKVASGLPFPMKAFSQHVGKELAFDATIEDVIMA
jgi:hypothetical protein